MATRLISVEKEIQKQIENKVKNKLDKIVSSLRNATPVDTGRARDGWRHTGEKIENDVEYISDLNDGSSQQAPSYFVERTILSHEGVKPNGAITRLK